MNYIFSPVLAVLLALSSPIVQNSKSKSAAPQYQKLADEIDRVRTSVVAIVIALPYGTTLQAVPEKWRSGFADSKGTGTDYFILGTGFLVNSKGDTITALHVVDDAPRVLAELEAANIKARFEIALQGPSEASIQVEMRNAWHGFEVVQIERNPEHDIAVISPNHDSFRNMKPLIQTSTRALGATSSAVIFDPSQPREGDDVFVCGYPVGSRELTTTSGHVANSWEQKVLETTKIHGLGVTTDVYQLDLLSTWGNSGGPAFLRSNTAVTAMVVESSFVAGATRAVVVPSKYITEFLDKLNVIWSYPVQK